MDNKYYLALDLEMNCGPNSTGPGKIIQVGVAIGRFQDYICQNQYEEFSWYINPNQKIYQNIIELTGITDEIINSNSITHQTIHDELKQLINKFNCYPNPIVWGGGDAKLLIQEFRENNINCQIFGHRELDVKTLHTFNLIANDRNTKSSLRSALNSYRLKFEGTPHRAVDDARNTLNLFFNMLNREINVLDLISRANLLK